MNPQIKQLAVEAGFQRGLGGSLGTIYSEEAGFIPVTDELSRFADAILELAAREITKDIDENHHRVGDFILLDAVPAIRALKAEGK